MTRAAPALIAAALLAGCGRADHPPPPRLTFDGLPLAGSLAVARRAGFTDCLPDTIDMRCRRDGVFILGQGPFQAAVDLDGDDGGGGFDQLTLWNDRDQYAVYAIADAFQHRGWSWCMTGEGARGDQDIYTRPGWPFRVSMDLSYWGKRRLRLIPLWNKRERGC